MLVGRNESREVELSATVLLEFLKTMPTGKDIARLLMVSKALRDFILSNADLRERYWKTKTRHYFDNINIRHPRIPGVSWEARFFQLENKHHEGLTQRLSLLFSAARSNNLPALQSANLLWHELFQKDKKNVTLYNVIAKNRHQGVMHYVFNDVIIPHFTVTKNNKTTLTLKQDDHSDYNLFHHAALLNQAMTSIKGASKDRITTALNKYAEHHYADVNTEPLYLSPLHLAARCGNIAAIQAWVKAGAIDPNTHGRHNTYTPLHEAARAGNCASIKTLLELGAHIDASTYFIHYNNNDSMRFRAVTPLALAVLYDHFKAFNLLIRLGANILPESQRQLLHFAKLSKNLKILSALSPGDIDTNEIYAQYLPSLHTAAKQGDHSVVESLLADNPNPDETMHNGNTLIHSATTSRSLPTLTLVLNYTKKTTSINTKNKLGQTPLHLAINHNTRADIVSALLEADADVNAENASGETPLHLAMHCYDIKAGVVSMLLAKGANVHAVQSEGKTPLHYAAECRAHNAELTKMLMDHGAKVDVYDQDRRTPLEYLLRRIDDAVRNKENINHTKQLALFIEKRAALNHQVKSIKCLNFSTLEVPLFFLLGILRKTPALAFLDLKHCTITFDYNTKNNLALNDHALPALGVINITGVALHSILLLKTIVHAASQNCTMTIDRWSFEPKSIDPNIQGPDENAPIETIQAIHAILYAPNKPQPHTHTTLFAHPNKRSSESEASASKHLKVSTQP